MIMIRLDWRCDEETTNDPRWRKVEKDTISGKLVVYPWAMGARYLDYSLRIGYL
jgi:hypothetical protein